MLTIGINKRRYIRCLKNLPKLVFIGINNLKR